MNHTTVVAAKFLNEALRERWIEEVRLSDNWYLRFSNDIWLSAYELELSAESSLRSLLSSSAPALLQGTDAADNVPKMACLCALMREEISRCHVDENGTLHIIFERGEELRAETNVPVVDWMWSVGSAPGDPYQIPSFAYCLSAREVVIGTLGQTGSASRTA